MFDAPQRVQVPLQLPDYVPVVAEIGINHNGDKEVAIDMIRQAAEAGADYVKFQTRNVDSVYSNDFLDSPRESPWGTTQRDQKEALEFGLDTYMELKSVAKEVGVELTSSAWDLESLTLVESLDPPFHKVPSALMTNESFLQEIASLKRPVVASTGMLSERQLDKAVEILSAGDYPLTLMHTVSVYPCPEENLNLMAIPLIMEKTGLPVGYSGHEPSLSPSIMALALGASILERHVTLSRSMYGSDQAASLEMRGLRDLVGAARKWPSARGDGVKRMMPGEEEVARKLRYWE